MTFVQHQFTRRMQSGDMITYTEDRLLSFIQSRM